MQETKQEIAKLHNHKTPGPEKIVNEFLKYGGPVLTGKIEELFNKIFKSETIPNQWREAILVKIDKGKKDKEKLENKRGISLSNSISKVFEKIIVRRVHNEICFTEAQAGGRLNRSTIDQIFTLKSVVQQRFYEKKQTYVAFIDLEKAYDQAWKDAVLYTLWNRGIKGKIWRVIYESNSNQKIKIQTKFGLTDEVIVNDSLRQGKPLSGPEFACFIDDQNCQLLAKDLETRYLYLTIALLLFMDNISAIAESKQELTKMLQVIDNFLSKWQLKVNRNKSGIIVFNEKYNVNRKEKNLKINIGNKVLESKNSYKYLGEIITPNLKVATHLQAKKIQINGIIQLLLNSPEIKHLKRIQINTLRKIIKLSTSNPIPIIYSEIVEIPIQFRFHERQLLYLWKLVNKKDQANDVYRIQSHEYKTNTGSAASYYKQLLVTYDITTNENGLSKTSKAKLKKIAKSKISHQGNQWYKTEPSKLSKLQEINKKKKIIKREKYVTQFKRTEVSLLIKARSRMLNLKNNFKGQFKGDFSCPRCDFGIDDENHVFTGCPKLKNLHVKYEIHVFEDVFENTNLEKLRKVA